MSFSEMVRALGSGEWVMVGFSRSRPGWIVKRVGFFITKFVPLPEGWVLPR